MMNITTGEIYKFKNDDEFNEISNELKKMSQEMIEINLKDITEKQKKLMKVSKYDNRSKLGKKFRQLRLKNKKK